MYSVSRSAKMYSVSRSDKIYFVNYESNKIYFVNYESNKIHFVSGATKFILSEKKRQVTSRMATSPAVARL